MSPRREEITCPECGTANPGHTKFCESCGLRLVDAIVEQGEAVAPKRVAKKRRSAEVHDSERREINRAVARARTRLRSIRKMFIVLTVLCGVATLLIWAGVSDAPKDEQEFLYLALGISGAMTMLLLAASIFLYDQPLFWVVTVASIYTVATILSPGILAIVICVALWGALPVILNVTRLQREYPDLITAENLQHRAAPKVSEASARRIEARRVERRSQAIRSYAIVAAVLVLGVVLIFVLPTMSSSVRAGAGTSSGPEPLSAAESEARDKAFLAILERFETAWADSDHDAIEAIGSQEFLDQRWYKVKSILERRGWSDSFPPIEYDARVGKTDDTREVWFKVTPKGQLKTRWIFEDEKWRVRRIVFSRTR